MTILDAYAVLAFLKDEAAAPEVEVLIAGGGTAMTALGMAEMLDHLIRLGGANEEDASLDLAHLGLDPPVVVDDSLAAAAGRLRARSYHRANCLSASLTAWRPRPPARRDGHWPRPIRHCSMSATTQT